MVQQLYLRLLVKGQQRKFT